uniref:Fatty acid-binding protein n=1 Tax=Lepidoglyphus destructor TaxID=36936 RepID=FABP_LEPDS|nr:RecName: Full=Fatty acid-binding protein; AltName: Allergen=Lep d 13 [Lepidoglyphus destructor]CAB62213.1 allergen [Lepidoglyphus destructor]
MANIAGQYKLDKSENFDQFLDKLGVGFLVKTAAKTVKPTLEVAVDGDTYIFRSLSTFKNTEIKFKLGEEFEEDRADGKRVKTVIVKDGDNKFVQTQYGDKEVKVVREFKGDEVEVTASVDGVTSVRPYKRA